MGGVLSTSGVSDSTSLKCDAPIELVWETVTDLESIPHIMTHVTAVTFPGSQSFERGVRWRETRVYKGRKYIADNTVTEVGSKPLSMSLGANVAEGAWMSNIQSSGTLILLRIDDSSCELVGSIAYQLDGTWGMFRLFLCYSCLVHLGRTVLRDDLADYKAEAERRYAERGCMP